MHLYQLTDQYKNLLATLESDDLTEESLKTQLIEVTTQLNDKVESIGKLILDLESEFLVTQMEIERLSKRKRIAENKIEWLKSYVLQEMLLSGLDKIQGNVLTLSIRTNPMSINVLDQNLIPKEYQRLIPESWVVDKKKIADYTKSSGEVLPGVEVITSKKSLMIK